MYQWHFKLLDSKNELHNVTTVSFLEGGLKSLNNSNPGQKAPGILVFEIAQNADPVSLTYDDYTNKFTLVINSTSIE